MNRRDFLTRVLPALAAAAVIDPERLLWTPGRKTIFDLGGYTIHDSGQRIIFCGKGGVFTLPAPEEGRTFRFETLHPDRGPERRVMLESPWEPMRRLNGGYYERTYPVTPGKAVTVRAHEGEWRVSDGDDYARRMTEKFDRAIVQAVSGQLHKD